MKKILPLASIPVLAVGFLVAPPHPHTPSFPIRYAPTPWC